MSIGQINIQDVYAAAALGVPVQPGLGVPFYGPRPNMQAHGDSYEGHGSDGHMPWIFKALLTLTGVGLGAGFIAALFRNGSGGRQAASKMAGASTFTRRWYKPWTLFSGSSARKAGKTNNIPFPEESTDRLVGTAANTGRTVYPHRGGRLNPLNRGQGRTALPRNYY